MIMKKIFLGALVSLFVFAPAVFAGEGLGNLIELARNQGAIQKAYERETDIYGSVVKAIEKGNIYKGQTKDEIEKRYGEPVIVLAERGTTREKWYYKKASSSFFGGERLVLFFDKDGVLDEILVENKK